MRKSIIAILMTFCLSIMTYAQTPRDRATEIKRNKHEVASIKKITSKHVTYSKRHTKHLQPEKTIHRQ